MGKFVKGDLVTVDFPNLNPGAPTPTTRRGAIVVAVLGYDAGNADYIVACTTRGGDADPRKVSFKNEHLSKGRMKDEDGFIRYMSQATFREDQIHSAPGRLNNNKLNEVIRLIKDHFDS